jgi:hypothetical protein
MKFALWLIVATPFTSLFLLVFVFNVLAALGNAQYGDLIEAVPPLMAAGFLSFVTYRFWEAKYGEEKLG